MFEDLSEIAHVKPPAAAGAFHVTSGLGGTMLS
jgi:hypothetical protein